MEQELYEKKFEVKNQKKRKELDSAEESIRSNDHDQESMEQDENYTVYQDQINMFKNEKIFNEHLSQTLKRNNSNIDPFIGTYNSNGSANGKNLYAGPRGGIYYINNNGNKTYLDKYRKITGTKFD